MPESSPNPIQPDNDGLSPASPRAFATATGLVFQVVGFIYFLSACCLWSLAGKLIDRPAELGRWWSSLSPATQAADPAADAVSDSGLAQRTTAVAVMGTVAGGLALVAFGIGMQGEKPRSATWGAVAAGALALLWLTAAAIWIISAGAWLRAGVALLMAGANGVLLLLAAYSARIFRIHPPPVEAPFVGEEFDVNARTH